MEHKKIEIRTEESPITNYLPSLPKAKEMQWCSQTPTGRWEGLGSSPVWLYIFAFYDEDVKQLISIDVKTQEVLPVDITPYFLPEQLKGKDISWQEAKSPFPYFQKGVYQLDQIATKVYFNETWNVIYIEAVLD